MKSKREEIIPILQRDNVPQREVTSMRPRKAPVTQPGVAFFHSAVKCRVHHPK